MDQAGRNACFELGPEPQTVEELRRLQTEMPPSLDRRRAERAEDRSSVDLPVQIAWQTSDGRKRATTARAREIAATSIFFEVDPSDRLCSPELLVELEPGQQVSLCAVARVVRVESRGGKIGIAVVLGDYCMREVR